MTTTIPLLAAATVGFAKVEAQEAMLSSRLIELRTETVPLVNPIDAELLRDGRVVVLDYGLPGLVVFEDGRAVRALGERGEGPGEYQRPSALSQNEEGHLHVFDEALQRLSILDTDGQLIEDHAVPPTSRRIGKLYSVSDRATFIRTADGMTTAIVGDLTRDTVEYSVGDVSGRATRFVVEVPGQMIAAVGVSGNVGYRPAPFTPVPREAVVEQCAVVAPGDTDELIVVDLRNAAVRRRFSVGIDRRPVADDDVERWLEAGFSTAAPGQMATLARLAKSMPRPAEMPAIHNVSIDPDGLVWIQEFEPPMGAGRRVVVADLDGNVVSRETLPVSGRILDVGSDRLLLVWRDALDVPRLAVVDIHRRNGRDDILSACGDAGEE